MKKLILFVLICINIISCSQIKNTDLIGSWELDRKEQKSEDAFLEDLKDIFGTNDTTNQHKVKVQLKFDKNNIFNQKYGERQYRGEYKIKKNKLAIGAQVFNIERIDSDSLIIIEENQEGLSSIISPTRYYYFKLKKELKPIKEFENFEENYSNGQLKIRGKYHNGLEDGLWEEWWENGQKKSERHFNYGIPIGIWKEWYENGQEKSEKQHNGNKIIVKEWDEEGTRINN